MDTTQLSADVGSLQQVGDPTRVTHIFTVPEKLQRLVKIKTVTLVELTVDEEIMATQRAGQNVLQITYRCAEQSLFAIDGQRVSLSDGTADTAYAKMHPKMRQLVVRGYNAIHNPAGDELEDFLGSQSTEVG